MCERPRRDLIVRSGRWLATTLAVAGCYYAGARLGLLLALVREQVTPLWPPTGIALAALLVFGKRALPGVALGALVTNVALGPSGLAVAAITAGNTIAPLIAYLILERAGFRCDLGRVRDALALVLLAALAAMSVSSTIGSAALVLTDAVPLSAAWSTWSVWWAGDSMGVLTVTPVLLAVRAARPSLKGSKRWFEAGALVSGVSVVAITIALGRAPLLFLFVPFLVWSAWRFRLLLTTSCSLLATVSAALAAVHGRAAFKDLTTVERMATLQLFNGSVVLIALLVTAAVNGRRQAQRVVELSARELDGQVKARTAELAGTVERLELSEKRVNEAQQAGQVGSWERDLNSDTVTWSDQMFRLHGLTPRSVAVDYRTFLDCVHPDDRELVAESNADAVRERRDTEFDHRVVWLDGSVHWIHQRGTVVPDNAGTPVRMLGIAQEITAAKIAEDTLRHSEERFRALLASIPDAVVGVDSSGSIILANERTEELFGYCPSELVGQPVEILMPLLRWEEDAQFRTALLTQSRSDSPWLELLAQRRDGSEFPADIVLSPLRTTEPGESAGLVIAAVRDVTERRQAESAARQLREARQQRHQALEINDNVMQGLSASLYALERDDVPVTVDTLVRTMRAARQMMANLLDGGINLAPGDLVRQRPATLPGRELHVPAKALAKSAPATGIRVVVADDSPQIRFALSAYLESVDGITLVGKAADGAEAVRVVAECRPDVVLLDLAMPILDGLGALSKIREVCPEAKVIILSGYGRTEAAGLALSRGAAGYVEKGGSMSDLTALLNRLFPHTIKPSSAL